ncbi:MAG: hypothetical protein HY042_00965 [Spirochaetia bacterium]|nr:hypothetical protein [Spirochaetia bacterium]
MAERYRFLLHQLRRLLNIQCRLAIYGRADEVDRFFPAVSRLITLSAQAKPTGLTTDPFIAALENECLRLNQEVTTRLESEYDALGTDVIRAEARRKITEFIRSKEAD